VLVVKKASYELTGMILLGCIASPIEVRGAQYHDIGGYEAWNFVEDIVWVRLLGRYHTSSCKAMSLRTLQ
jgi:hypothetical protein